MIKVGFIGTGDISLLHAEGVHLAENAELTGIWNRTRGKAEEKSKLFNCRVFDSAEDLIKAVDVVYVLTNMETHHKYARQAIDAGKHVLVEKPTAVTIEEIEDLKKAASSRRASCASTQLHLRTICHAGKGFNRKWKNRRLGLSLCSL